MATLTDNRRLQRLGLTAPRLALLCVPANYVDCRFAATSLRDVQVDGAPALLKLRYSGAMKGTDRSNRGISQAELTANRPEVWRRIKYLQIELLDRAGEPVWLTVFGNVWDYRERELEGELHVVGRLKRFRELVLDQPQFPPEHAIDRVWVQYAGVPGRVSGDVVERLIRQVVDDPLAYSESTREVVAGTVTSQQELLRMLEQAGSMYSSIENILRDLHTPPTPARGWAASEACKLISIHGVGASARARTARLPHRRAPLALPESVVMQVINSQPESLTADQATAVAGLVHSLREATPVTALLSGDVCTGKTLTFLIPAVAAHLEGASVVIMAPNTILADQIADVIARRFGNMIRGVERVATGGKLREPSNILVGTSGLASICEKAGLKPNVLILDEQHKMSGEDRERLCAPFTHVIETTATPIPRSMATAKYGGMDVFNLRQKPVRQDIKSLLVGADRRGEVSRWMRETVAAGERLAVIFPRVETALVKVKGEDKVLAGLLSAGQVLERHFPGKVVTLHGKMPDAEIRAAIEKLRSGECPVVVASTVLEAGIDIPSITMMVVRTPENFGIAQLHQLRGRLARNGGRARYVMMTDDLQALDQTTRHRLRSVETTNDGFELAEIDLSTRGFGDVTGIAQSGSVASVFKLIDVSTDEFLGQAQQHDQATGTQYELAPSG